MYVVVLEHVFMYLIILQLRLGFVGENHWLLLCKVGPGLVGENHWLLLCEVWPGLVGENHCVSTVMLGLVSWERIIGYCCVRFGLVS